MFEAFGIEFLRRELEKWRYFFLLVLSLQICLNYFPLFFLIYGILYFVVLSLCFNSVNVRHCSYLREIY